MSYSRALPLATLFTAMGMEMSCLYLVLAVIGQHAGISYPSIALILALYPVSVSIGRVMPTGVSKRSLILGIIAAFTLVAAITAMAVGRVLTSGSPSNIFNVGLQAAFGGLAWWLGSTLVQRDIDHRTVSGRFQVWIMVLLLFAAIGNILMPVLLFFTMAALALALARWQASAARSMAVLRGFQLWPVLLGSLGVLLPGIAILLALSPAVARAILDWIGAVGGAIARLLNVDQSPPQVPGKPVEFNFSCACKPESGGIGSMPSPPPEGAPTQTNPVILWLIVFAIVIGVLLFIVLTVRRSRRQRPAEPRQEIAAGTVTLKVSFFGQLAALVKKAISRLRDFFLGILSRLGIVRLRSATTDEPAISLRALYRSLLRWGARRGLPRLQSQTPLEYLGALSGKFPQEEAALSTVTGLYIQARYSRRPVASEEFETARRAWHEIRQAS